ncbi:Alg9-like mannosyltransferase family-domain-containing protein [Xylaria palmicola]|nr:Alg9-like mannosyltransferase family-domain-containing protein [Xylaria palmicola]
MPSVIDTLLSLLIPALAIVHLVVAPYTKVEESFNIQATHDILAYGTPTSNVYKSLSSRYDHFDFPGAVPRTFIGPVVLAGISQPFVALAGFQHAQLVVRALLGLINSAALLYFKSQLQRAFGRSTARWYTLLQASQFHVIFYASRLLPNMFAFPLTTLAFSQLLPHPDPGQRVNRYKRAIALLTMATAIFRSELTILMVAVGYYVAFRMPPMQIIKPFVAFFVLALAISVPIDSYFWQKPLWPELWGFYYNAVLGLSSDWGVSPFSWYFTSALPKILTNPISYFLMVFALWQPGTYEQAFGLVFPSWVYVLLYSLQPHKETRFIIYVAPPLTAAAALGANYIFSHRTKNRAYALASATVIGSILASFAISSGMLVVSSLNYPGGEALAALKDLVASSPSLDIQTASVHTDVLSCMTGVTLFGQNADNPGDRAPAPAGASSSSSSFAFEFDKTEDEPLLASPPFWEKFDYVLAEDPAKPLGPWETVGVVEGFAGYEVLGPGAETTTTTMTARAGGLLERGRDRVLGRAALLSRVREAVRARTRGWWVGPRTEPRVYILRRLREGEARRAVTA